MSGRIIAVDLVADPPRLCHSTWWCSTAGDQSPDERAAEHCRDTSNLDAYTWCGGAVGGADKRVVPDPSHEGEQALSDPHRDAVRAGRAGSEGRRPPVRPRRPLPPVSYAFIGDERDEALRRDLRQLLRERFLSLNPGLEFTDTDNLADLGVLDSLAFVELVEEVQQRYGVTVRDDEITEANFGSVASIQDYLTRKNLP